MTKSLKQISTDQEILEDSYAKDFLHVITLNPI